MTTVNGTSERGGFGGIALGGGAVRAHGDLMLHRTRASTIGDLEAAEFRVDTAFGTCHGTTLEGPAYQVRWGSYAYQPGLWYAESANQTALALYAQLGGSGDRSGRGPDGVELRSGEASLVVVPAGWSSGGLTRESRGSAFDLVLSRRYVLELAGRHPRLLEPVADRLEREQPGSVEEASGRIAPRAWGLIQRVQRLGGSADSGSGSLLLESAVLELVAVQLAGPDPVVSTGGVKLSRADVDGIHAARDLLLERLDDPPTLAELARHARTNEFKLKRGFREIFGTSPYAYFLRHRLELARSWLLDTDWSIARIGRRVGYRDPAHFTNAFRKHFGVPPSALRRPHGGSGGAAR